MGAVIGIVLSAVVIAILLAIFYASNKNADTSKEDDRSRKTANGTVKNKDIETYKGKPPTQKLSSLDHGTIKKPMSYAEYSALTGNTISFPEKDVNGNPFDISDVDFSAMLYPSYPYNLKPQKSLSEKLYDLYLSCVRDSYNAIDKNFFGKITKEYTFYPIVNAYASSVLCMWISATLISIETQEEKAIEVLNGFLKKVAEHCDRSFGDMKEQKNDVFYACQEAFIKVHAGEIHPKDFWISGFHEVQHPMMALLVAFGDMMCSENVAKDYENGVPSSCVGYSVPLYQTSEFGIKIMDEAKPIFCIADAVIALIKAQ